MCEALRIDARYGTPDSKGETRRERNARFDVASPNPVWPPKGMYLLEWFRAATCTRQRDANGLPLALAHTEWQAWAEMAAVEVRPEEYKGLLAMDRSYVNALQTEIVEIRQREAQTR